jgi:ubiquinone/menaquinone biosynthesis C-methylase UbiE
VTFLLDPEETEIAVIHDLIPFQDKRVLEIGAGDGRLTWRFAERARQVLALDPDAGRVERARDALPNALRDRVTFTVADVTSAELAEASFDVAVLSWSI